MIDLQLGWNLIVIFLVMFLYWSFFRKQDPDLVVESMSQPTQASTSSTSLATANERALNFGNSGR